ncbi:hypothetical protein Vafri_5115 [Volvox africanus]|nr:hypothetical protein Vafri_5115 [Volvox africanus]
MEKARARVIILSRPREDRELYLDGTYAEAAATIKALLKETRMGSLNPGPVSLPGGSGSTASRPAATPTASASIEADPVPRLDPGPATFVPIATKANGGPCTATAMTITSTTTTTTTRSSSDGADDADIASSAAFKMGAINAEALNRVTAGSCATSRSLTNPKNPPDAAAVPSIAQVAEARPTGAPSARNSTLSTTSSGLRVRWANDQNSPPSPSQTQPSEVRQDCTGEDRSPSPPPSVPWWRSADPGASSMVGYTGCKGLDFASPSASPSSSSSSSPRLSTTALNLAIYSLRTGISEAYDAVSRVRLNQPPIIFHSAAEGTSQFGNAAQQQYRHQPHRKQCKHYQTQAPTATATACGGSPFAPAGAYKLAQAGSSGSSSSSTSRRTASELLVETAASISHLAALPAAFRAVHLRERQPGDMYFRTVRKVLDSSAVGRVVQKIVRFIMVVDVHEKATLVLVKVRSKEIGRQVSKKSSGSSVSPLYRSEVVADPADSFEAVSERLDRRAVKVADIVMWEEVPGVWCLWDGTPREAGVEYEPYK